MAGVFELHDKSRFNVTAISIGPIDTSEMRQRLKNSFDEFIDARTFSDDEIASQLNGSEIDILVDLKGFTQDARTGIFARRPAPIQVNYLGYPGTMGADYFDYLVADHTVVPKSSQGHYAEKIVYLPNSYQANDTKRTISSKLFTRAECKLPENGFVFCCFNNNYKIIPEVFDCWMRILHRTNDSVLWLLESNAMATSNLRKEATARGISAERLVFAPYMPYQIILHGFVWRIFSWIRCHQRPYHDERCAMGRFTCVTPNWRDLCRRVGASLLKRLVCLNSLHQRDKNMPHSQLNSPRTQKN